MFKKIFITAILSFFFFGILQSQEKINQFNAKGKRVGLWKKFYPNGKIRYQGRFENGKEVGDFKFYSPKTSKFPIIVKTYENNTEICSVKYFTSKGIIESKGTLNGKKRVGKWQYFHKNGKTVVLEENYKNNVLDGVYKVFYKNGKLAKVSYYKNGKLDGNSKKYSPNEILIEDVNYVDGELNGMAFFYEKNGNLKLKGLYKNDLKVGVWNFYENGKLKKSKEIKVFIPKKKKKISNN